MHGQDKNYNKMVADTLQTVGVKKGQQLLDFGCGSGDYTIPAAKIIGDEGKVYAVDKDKRSLNSLRDKASSLKIGNIQIVHTSGELELPVHSNSIDFIVLYDVLHSYYFTPPQRNKFFNEIHRIAKKDSVISVNPKHMVYRMLINEMSDAGIYFCEKFFVDMLHYHVFEQDYLFNFRLS